MPGSLESVQRAEFWGVILALQAAAAVHVGVDNLNVVRYVGRLIEGFLLDTKRWGLALVGPEDVGKELGLTRVSKVKGHDDDMVRVRSGSGFRSGGH